MRRVTPPPLDMENVFLSARFFFFLFASLEFPLSLDVLRRMVPLLESIRVGIFLLVIGNGRLSKASRYDVFFWQTFPKDELVRSSLFFSFPSARITFHSRTSTSGFIANLLGRRSSVPSSDLLLSLHRNPLSFFLFVERFFDIDAGIPLSPLFPCLRRK